MLVLSRDGAWLSRLENLAERGGWPFEARAALPSPGRTPPPERALAVLDRALAGGAPAKAVSVLRALYPGVAIVLSVDASEMDYAGAAAAVSCGADEVVGKAWTDAKLSQRLAILRDRSLFSQTRISADGALKAERRAHRVHVKARGGWKEVELDAGGFALLWRLLEREGESVSRAELGQALASATGRERESATVTRRLAALKKALARWPGAVETARGGLYRLASPRRREA
ncbi:MAG: winged helix-turn-helix domain-containing protein [Elusimicrobia bacterium]|nr:winged helix-turn-helix domain-containing protein [Elusimicrobiota bacterium]